MTRIPTITERLLRGFDPLTNSLGRVCHYLGLGDATQANAALQEFFGNFQKAAPRLTGQVYENCRRFGGRRYQQRNNWADAQEAIQVLFRLLDDAPVQSRGDAVSKPEGFVHERYAGISAELLERFNLNAVADAEIDYSSCEDSHGRFSRIFKVCTVDLVFTFECGVEWSVVGACRRPHKSW